jgi:hypothetical protein
VTYRRYDSIDHVTVALGDNAPTKDATAFIEKRLK